MKIKKLFGDKKFYMMVLSLAVPIMIQNGITNFVSLLDNIMVGATGTEQMSGVAIANQLMFVFNLCVFGAVSGASIFGAQFYGQRDFTGMKHAFRFKMYICLALSLISILIFTGLGDTLINQYLKSSSENINPELTFGYGYDYLMIMLIGLIPFAISQVYSSTLREMGETLVPMISGISAVIINLFFNYVLIFGNFGAPKLGVEGAAIATVISRFVEVFIVVIWTHLHAEKYPFIIGVYKSFRIPTALVKKIILRGSPLLINEALWSGGTAVIMQCYSLRGLDVIPALNINSTISNLFNIAFIALGSSIAIVVGPLLGANEAKAAKETAAKMITFSVLVCIGIGMVMAITAPFFPTLYNTTEDVRSLAASLIIVSACFMPVYGFGHATYFTLRAGGKTIITFLFDSGFMWVIAIPLAYTLAKFTAVPIIPLFVICQAIDLIKCVIGFSLVKKGVWINNIVTDTKG